MGDLLGWCSWWPYHAPDRGGKKDVLRVALTHLWARGYFVASSGNVTDDVIMQYIATQDLQERARDDDFTIGA
jgi:REP element-mobilizing transposase RayT